MCQMIDDSLKDDESQTEIPVFTTYANLELVVNYCKAFDYIKMKSTFIFPANYSDLEMNVSSIEAQQFKAIKDDYDRLMNLFVCSKYFRCESLY